jgi:NTE family protein
MQWPATKDIALVLSGGGIRAMAFHLGVMRRMAELGLLERVSHVSSVSGGSLIVGLVLLENNLVWPSSQAFLHEVLPRLRVSLSQRSLQWGALRQLVRPRNLRFIASRANLLAAALKNEWGATMPLGDLPARPEWSINGTNAENGRRFRFKRHDLGDYLSGYADAKCYPLADAIAVSAAFPGGFGPLSIRTNKFTWLKRGLDAPKGSEVPVTPPFQTLHLYDGGVYDNLGLEPFFDAGRNAPKLPETFILVSDAGLPLSSNPLGRPISPFRLKRVADIMSDQARALRVRTFVHYVTQAPDRGGFVFIGCNASGMDTALAERAKTFPTTLRRLTLVEFDDLVRHGAEATDNGLGA